MTGDNEYWEGALSVHTGIYDRAVLHRIGQEMVRRHRAMFGINFTDAEKPGFRWQDTLAKWAKRWPSETFGYEARVVRARLEVKAQLQKNAKRDES